MNYEVQSVWKKGVEISSIPLHIVSIRPRYLALFHFSMHICSSDIYHFTWWGVYTHRVMYSTIYINYISTLYIHVLYIHMFRSVLHCCIFNSMFCSVSAVLQQALKLQCSSWNSFYRLSYFLAVKVHRSFVRNLNQPVRALPLCHTIQPQRSSTDWAPTVLGSL